MIWLNIGPPRTGTTSLWTFLKEYEEIYTWPRKEMFKLKNFDEPYEIDTPDLDSYFDVPRNYKFYLDGTPFLYMREFGYVLKEIKEYFTEIYFIYLLRNKEEHRKSLINFYLKNKEGYSDIDIKNILNRTKKDKFQDNMRYIKSFADKVLQTKIKKEPILDFLGLKDKNIEIKKLNTIW